MFIHTKPVILLALHASSSSLSNFNFVSNSKEHKQLRWQTVTFFFFCFFPLNQLLDFQDGINVLSFSFNLRLVSHTLDLGLSLFKGLLTLVIVPLLFRSSSGCLNSFISIDYGYFSCLVYQSKCEVLFPCPTFDLVPFSIFKLFKAF